MKTNKSKKGYFDIKKNNAEFLSEKKRYKNPIVSRDTIIKFLTKSSKPISYRILCSKFDIKSHTSKDAFFARLRAMVRDGQIIKTNYSYSILDSSSQTTKRGVISTTKSGYGFVDYADGTSAFVSSRQVQYLMDGDIVLTNVIKTQKGFDAFIVNVEKRATKFLIGKLVKNGSAHFLKVRNKIMASAVEVFTKEDEILDYDKLLKVKITRYPDKKSTVIQAEIFKYIDVDLHTTEFIMQQFNIEEEWSESVIKETENIEHNIEKALKNREDLRSIPFITIDGESSKDFDDAIYVEKTPKNGWEVLVAIADVSHYVKPGSEIDNEAIEKGNSVYFVNKTVPMLPEILSNNLCSLVPNEDRLAFVCKIIFDKNAVIKSYSFMEAVINSSSRQTYNKIEDLLTNKKTKEEIGLPEVAYKSVIEAKNIANKLLEIRHERNALDFDLATMNLNLNQDCTNIKHIDSTERLFAHQLIEELMIAANKCAAGKIKTFSKNSWIFRTHKQPSNSKFENLVKTMLRFNIKPVQKKKNIISKITSIFNKSEVSNHAFALGSILEQAKQHEQKDLLQVLILQSMSPASYSNVEGEHFGLSLDLYTHFTSPIRRYADLMVHRILKEPKKYEKTEELESVCIQCSKMEKNAERATKSLEQIFICNFANQYIGKPTNGIISKMLPSSCLINLVEFKIYAEISKDELKKHNLQIDYKSNSIFNRKTKKYFGLGKKLKVSICDTDELKTKINLTIIKG